MFERIEGVRKGKKDEEAREKLVALMWDSLASLKGAPDAVTAQRLDEIATHVEGRVLDVGCGQGSMFKRLKRNGYVGCDLSGEMIAGIKHKGDFRHANFFDIDEHFDTVLFCGSLQFFANLTSVFQRCQMIAERVVIAHTRGALFVREERLGNPYVVPCFMPDMDELQSIGHATGFTVTYAHPHLAHFYLAVLDGGGGGGGGGVV
ncbi:hypothetical protein CTAYLR_008670 [Chrysophaeum taylorii]|uniref:Methyltransferase type 11 domain-containing protein n=1 Tax=Chrysophaeum taylorii TaxID=2483200 RepID=A0AAD7UQ89_9STRA|nr:hypothetical protein CTAYLR_008670 [Chrysophaeum taylorii]